MPTSLTEAVGAAVARTVTIAYDPTFVHLPDTITSAGVTRSFTYDPTGNPLTIKRTDTTTTTAPYATGGQARTVTNTWSNFLLASTQTPNGNKTSLGYDASGALTSVTDALGHIMQITMHTGGGLPQVIVDPNNVTTTLTYDQRQRLRARTVMTGAGALATTFDYDPAGNLTRTTLPDGSFIASSYDAAHRVTGIADALANAIAYTLDALGDRTAIAVSDSGGTVRWQHATTFDALGRPLVDTAGAGQATTVTYDKNGNALTVTDGLNHKTTRTFDALNRLATSTDANGGVTTPTYDPHNRLTALKDANNNTTSYVRDGFGEAIGQTSPDTGATVYHFDADGNLTSKLDALGVTVNLTYDALDRLLTRSFPADATQNVTYSYDAPSGADAGTAALGFLVGRLAARTDASGATAFTYDERGDVLNAQASGTPGGANISVSYGYDKASRLQAIGYPSGLVVAYARDAQGNVNAVAITPPGATAASTIATLSTLPFGPDNATALGNGVSESRTFDLDYRMTNVTASGSAATLENLTYTLDMANNVTAIADAVNAANGQTLGYDVINRLTSATSGPGYGSLAWVLDKVGNRTSQTAAGVTTTYGYAVGSNRLASITSGGITTPVVTNANGNITSIPPANASAAATFAYNVANRLSSVTGSPTPASYLYDDWGRRVSKTAGGVTTTFAYGVTGMLLEEVTGNAATDYIYVGGRPLALFATAATQGSTGTVDSGEVGSNLLRTLKRHGSGARLAVAALVRTRAASGASSVLLLAAGLLLAAFAWMVKPPRSLRQRARARSSNSSPRRGDGGRGASLTLTPLALALIVAGCVTPTSPPDAGQLDAEAEGGVIIADAQVADSTASPDAAGDATSASADASSDASVVASDSGTDAGTDATSGSADAETSDTSSTEGGGTDATVAADGGGNAGSDGGPPITGGALYYLHTDHLGTPQLATDKDQNTVWATTYQPYGATGTVTRSITQNLRLPGQYFDSETGFHQNGFRDYMPGLGRYLEVDPIGLAGAMNSYAYVNGNPMTSVDPRGLWQVTVTLGWGWAGQLTFGINHGQFNFGLYGGEGTGFSAEIDMTDAQCQAQGLEAGVKGAADLGVKLPGGLEAEGSAGAEANTNGDLSVEVGGLLPPIGAFGGRLLSTDENPRGSFIPYGKGTVTGKLFGFYAYYFAGFGGKYTWGGDRCGCKQ